jgi:quercetin 2,3-dioxygenase
LIGVNVRAGQWAALDRSGDEMVLEANNDAVVLLLSGEPIDEPIAAYGPFVMNTQAEIAEAIEDYNSGAFGRMTS